MSVFSLNASGFFAEVSAGYALSLVQAPVIDREDTYFRNGHGYDVSVLAGYSFTNNVSLSAGLRFVEKKYTLDRPEHDTYNGYRNQYLEFPFHVGYSLALGEDFGLTFGLGVYCGAWLSRYQASRELDVGDPFGMHPSIVDIPEERKGFDERLDRRFAFGVEASVSLDYTAGRTTLFISPSIRADVLGLCRDYQRMLQQRRVHVFAVDAGARIGL